ncbi:uncharacterized protein LAESUDRAFT_809946 [Laetiporus sulphureus 93-53]|uniref:Jacalin-type lectin domain-containing protein n=1 Tax=Laetiporus sulphureus 93-53 TaxID=1314785 RepID=A0A165GEI4_9APHY|nr:uncharacterized protein LAESUDRAFT_809946 [Laetiporus sulphureus 93-53]KZT10239.1 hypothetical protein LAESUDRAFT_809946 [Laetiporus sulphureus 93-53]
MLDLNHPITRIELSAGWVLDGLKIHYKLKHPNLRNITVTHGEFAESADNRATINLQDSEIILAIYGRAGYQNFYKQKLINSINFIIFDQQTSSFRVSDTFGNKPGCLNENNGSTFHVSNVMAFAGHDNGGKGEHHHGIVGLSFYTNANSELHCR